MLSTYLTSPEEDDYFGKNCWEEFVLENVPRYHLPT